MPNISIPIALLALAASPQEKPADAAVHQEAMRLGLAYVATGNEEPPEESAIEVHRETEEPLLRARRERILEAYTWSGCLGLYDLNHGDIVEVASDRIALDLAIDPAENKRWYQASRPQRYMSDEWIIVRWGEERYMVRRLR